MLFETWKINICDDDDSDNNDDNDDDDDDDDDNDNDDDNNDDNDDDDDDEKYYIMFNPDDATLNLRSEFFSHCWHKQEHLLTRSWSWKGNYCLLCYYF